MRIINLKILLIGFLIGILVTLLVIRVTDKVIDTNQGESESGDRGYLIDDNQSGIYSDDDIELDK